MRNRVVVPLCAFVLVAAAALLVPLLATVSQSRTRTLEISRSDSIGRLGQYAELALDGQPESLQLRVDQHFAVFDEPVVVVDATGEPVASAGDIDPGDDPVAGIVGRTLRNQPVTGLPAIRPWSDDARYLSAPMLLGGDLVGGAIVLQVNTDDAVADVRRTWALAIGAGVLAAAALTGFVWLLTRWILRPIAELEDAAAHLTSGMPTELHDSGPPELRQLTRAFDTMARSVTTTLEQQRQLVADSSHQLRNPLAGVRLRVDTITHEVDDPEIRAELDAVQADLDRLHRLVDRLLGLADAEHRSGLRRAGSAVNRASGGGARTDARMFADACAERWRERADIAGVSLAVTLDDVDTIGADAATLDEIVDTLVDNAVRYAGPRAEVLVAIESGADRWVHISVTDNGLGMSADERAAATRRFWRSPTATSSGTGLGLSIADELCASIGATLTLDGAPGGGLRAVIAVPPAVSS